MSHDKIKQVESSPGAGGHVQPVVILPCPFCGKEALGFIPADYGDGGEWTDNIDNTEFVGCHNCGVSLFKEDWNKRAV